jgi:saccharopine dehydrogenase (NAD+, L-lysine-forming)
MDKKIKIGIIKETKIPVDRRVVFPPVLAKKLNDEYDNVEVKVQKSDIRAFKDEEYEELGLPVVDDVSDCDVLFGVKEVKINALIPNKTYFFFSHTAKKQEYNKPLIKAIIEKGITLVDHEYLTDKNGIRLVAFGYWAGIVGAYNGMRAWGLKTGQFEIPPAHTFHDKKEMFDHINNFELKPFKIVITGGGRVASGAVETLKAFGIKEVIPEDFLTREYDYPVFTKLDPCHYVRHKDGKEFDLKYFFTHPDEFVSTFEVYTRTADMYIAAHFWDPRSPKFYTPEQTKNPEFKIKVVADISCDVDNAPVGTTLRASTIDDPFYDFNPETGKEEPAFSSDKNITVMAVDNLPGELPRDASMAFGEAMLEKVIPSLVGEDKDGIIERATIVKDGKLTERFSYLEEWVNS